MAIVAVLLGLDLALHVWGELAGDPLATALVALHDSGWVEGTTGESKRRVTAGQHN